MIEFRSKANLFDLGTDAIVNTVNCVGVMGAGLAKQFRQRFTHYYQQYQSDCQAPKVRTGQCSIFFNRATRQWIVSFPTKQDWRNPSQMEWIEQGLVDLASKLKAAQNVQSIAVPPLGCGLGGLNWTEVKARITEILGVSELSHIRIIVCEPKEVA